MAIDSVTKKWIRNASDELAAKNGCRFDPERGQFVIDWAAKYLRLYEGELAGEPLIAGDWQIEATMRLFGWIKWSDFWGKWIRRFSKASIWVPKKNGKSPTLAWWGLYLLAGDGEKGQKVYLAAKDGAQVREIVAKHAFQMAQESPELSEYCHFNQTTMQITYEPTDSILKPLSSSDKRSQKAKEGLNGSILIDETHVVDRAFATRINRAGASRSEPLHIEVSTAGNDPDSYGKSQYDYGKLVERGAVEDDAFFFLSYEAPQDLTEDELAEAPEKFGKMANPTWGRIINGEEYLDDFKRSRKSLTDMLDHMMYRLNVWQRSNNPWLRSADWDACKLEYAESDLDGQICWGGLDLSKTKDTTSLTLTFPSEDDEDEFFQLPYVWMPEETAQELRDLVPFLEWAKAGFIRLMPGEVIDYTMLREDIVEIAERFKIREIAYDPFYASEITQYLEENHGIGRVEFRQTMGNFAGPTAEYERLVIANKIHHPGNPLMSWQAGHVQVVSDRSGNKRPVKPEHNDPKKIDTIVAGIMSLARALLKEGGATQWKGVVC